MILSTEGACVARGHIGWGVCMAGGVCMARGMCGWEACMAGGHAWPGVCVARMGDMHDRGCAWPGGVHARGHAWQGVCMVGGVRGRGGMCGWGMHGGGVHGWGHTWQGGVHDMPPRADTMATAYVQ